MIDNYYPIEALKDSPDDTFLAEMAQSRNNQLFLKQLKGSCSERTEGNSSFSDLLLQFYGVTLVDKEVWLNYTLDAIIAIGGDKEAEMMLWGLLELSDLSKKPTIEEILIKNKDAITKRTLLPYRVTLADKLSSYFPEDQNISSLLTIWHRLGRQGRLS